MTLKSLERLLDGASDYCYTTVITCGFPAFFAQMIAVLTSIIVAATVADAVPNDPTTARAIIERAIESQGGEDQVAKLVNGPWHAKVKGKSGLLELNGEILHRSLKQDRISTTVGVGPAAVEVVAVTNDKKAWRSIAGFTSEVTGKDLEEMCDGEYRSRRVRFLLPLLREPGFKLSLLPETKVSDRPAVGVRVQSKGHRDVDLYFDKQTGLLVKSESRIALSGKRAIVLEQVSSDYRDFGGVKMATKFTKYENHKLSSVEEIVDLKFLDRIDDSEFQMPK